MDKESRQKRREAREFAFKLIYEINVQKDKELSELIADTEKGLEYTADEADAVYVKETLEGVMEKHEEIDAIISENSRGWKLSRISATSGAILRLAIYEMLYTKLNFRIAINEAVELAKKYDHEKAPKFINGILNAVAEKKRLKPVKAKAPKTEEPNNEDTKENADE